MEKTVRSIRVLAWGLDYKKTRRADAVGGERWLTTLTRLNDGRLLCTWEGRTRPAYAEVRQVLSRGLAQYAHPEILWCDNYLTEWAAPIASLYNLRLHVRMADSQLRVELPKEPEAVEAPAFMPEPEASFWRHYWEKFNSYMNREGASA